MLGENRAVHRVNRVANSEAPPKPNRTQTHKRPTEGEKRKLHKTYEQTTKAIVFSLHFLTFLSTLGDGLGRIDRCAWVWLLLNVNKPNWTRFLLAHNQHLWWRIFMKFHKFIFNYIHPCNNLRHIAGRLAAQPKMTWQSHSSVWPVYTLRAYTLADDRRKKKKKERQKTKKIERERETMEFENCLDFGIMAKYIYKQRIVLTCGKVWQLPKLIYRFTHLMRSYDHCQVVNVFLLFESMVEHIAHICVLCALCCVFT